MAERSRARFRDSIALPVQPRGLDILARFGDASSLPYPGGKAGAGVAHRIINLMPPHQVYIEPFLGDAAVMRAKRPAALNIGLDLDPESPGLAWLATLAEKSGARSRIAPDPLVKSGAAAGIVRSHVAGSGGGVLPGTASLPAARVDRGKLLASPAVASSAAIVGNGEPADYRFGCLDGIELLRVYPWTGRELVYCDPPYLMSTRSGRRLYKHEMTGDQHWQLLQRIRWLPCMVMISGYHSVLYADQLERWNSIHFEAMTRAGHTATEWLWFNFPPPHVLHDDRYLGEGFRKREQLKRKKARWIQKLRAMPLLDRQALLSAIASIDE